MSYVREFECFGNMLNATPHVIVAAWSYVCRFTAATAIEWWENPVYIYTAFSLASKMLDDRDTSEVMVERIAPVVRNVFEDNLADREVEIATILDWHLTTI
jgi:hypothetical protein